LKAFVLHQEVKDDNLRHLSGFNARTSVARLGPVQVVFRQNIADAHWQKIT
jgi:hypothetical protein